ncbi:MAG: FlgD immunoglobulin-like domain containing protein [bacterium]
MSAYSDFRPRVDAAYAVPSKLIISAQLDLNSSTMLATVTTDVTVAPGETIGTPSACKVRAALTEDNIVRCCEPHTGHLTWNYISRAMVFEVPLTDSLSGQTQHIVQTFPIDPSWNIRNLHAAVWVQRDTNKNILQAANATVAYEAVLTDLDPIVAKVTSGPSTFDDQVTNTGTFSDDVTLTLDESTLPSGWSADIVYNSTVYPSTVTIPNMAHGQVENVSVRVTPNGPGEGTVALIAAPFHNSTWTNVHPYHTFSQTPAILFVDDDNGASFEGKYQNAITGAGYWSVTQTVSTQGNPLASYINLFDALVWNTDSLQTNTIGTALQTTLMSYMDGGGKLFLVSQGILNERGLTPMVTGYLRVSAFTPDVGGASATGLAGDPIGDGLSFAVSPPFVNKADAVTPNTGGVAWLDAGLNHVAVRYDSGVYRTVFMTAPFEGIATPTDATVMKRVLDWLVPNDITAVPPVAGRDESGLALWQNAPNPFSGTTSLLFSMPQAGHARLTVYDVAGRRVASLVDRQLEAGAHSVVWDGRDVTGARTASGVYLVRLTANGRTVSREMVRVK